MSVLFRCTGGICVALSWAALLCAAATTVSFDSPQAFSSELGKLENSLTQPDASTIIAALPSRWTVRSPDGEYSIPSRPWHSGPLSVAEERKWLAEVATQAASYARPAPPSQSAHAVLTRILAQPEFEKEKPPGEWEQLKARIALWFMEQLQRLFALIARNPGTSHVLFWILISGSALLIAFFVRRWINGNKYRLQLSAQTMPANHVLSSDRWLSDAQAAAEAGDFRRAVQCAYWGAIAKLQDADSLPRAEANTPREYLRLLSQGDPAQAPLRRLTDQLERFWYAGAPATPHDFDITKASLQEIGCPLA